MDKPYQTQEDKLRSALQAALMIALELPPTPEELDRAKFAVDRLWMNARVVDALLVLMATT